jgi:hypothetical protein
MIWKHLPSELIHKIVLLSNPTIDTRLYFNIHPKKINVKLQLYSHDGIVYNVSSKSLHIFRIPGCHIIHRPVELDAMDEWMTIFNQNERAHTIETMTIHGTHVTTSNDSFYTEMRVLLKD